MASLRGEVDVAVVGAGAAGIGAARRLAQAGSATFQVLEARERIGGRLNTIDGNGLPLDLGGEWLHSADRNPLARLAEAAGFSLCPRLPEWTSRLRRSGETAAAEADWLATREAFRRRVEQAAAEPEDRPALSLLELALEREGPAAMAAFAIDELAGRLGNGIRRRLAPLATTAWAQDRFALGSYSYALPGHAGDRARLAAPVEGRLFFAGEACSPNFFSTAHGAFETGIAAADAALASLAAPR